MKILTSYTGTLERKVKEAPRLPKGVTGKLLG